MTGKFKWEYAERSMKTLEFLIVVLGVAFSVYQINDMSHQQLMRENDLSSNYYDQLNTGTNGRLTLALAHNKTIANNFTSDDLDNYLGIFNDIGDRLNRGILDPQIACNDFYDIAETAYGNKEIQAYLKQSQKIDLTYFAGFDSLNQFLVNDCK